MNRSTTTLLLACALVLACAPIAAAAGGDISSATPITVDSPVSDDIGMAGNTNDVWRIDLVEGQEVRFEVTPTGASGGTAKATLLAPGVTTVSSPSAWEMYGGSIYNGAYVDTSAHWSFTPAKSGTYYLWIAAGTASTGYEVTANRTANSAITTPDAGDIPGLPAAAGTIRGVVEAITDHDDVYAVQLFAGETVSLQMQPTNDVFSNGAYLYVLDPSSTTVANYSGWDEATDQSGAAADNGRTWAHMPYSPNEIASLTFTPATTGRYYLWVHATSIAGGSPYELSIDGHAEYPSMATALLKFSPSASPSSVSYNGYVTVKNTLRAPNRSLAKDRTLVLYKSTDKAKWTRVAVMHSSSGYYSKRVQIKRKTYFKWTNAADATYAAGESSLVSAKSKASLTKPSLTTNQRFYKTYTATGYLKPRHNAGSSSTKAYFYAKKGGSWVRIRTATVTVTNYGSYSKYSTKCEWGGYGSWSCRVRIVHSDSDHTKTYSAWKYFTVR